MYRVGVAVSLLAAISVFLAAGDVVARPLLTTNVLVQAIGQGTVSGIGINCGGGATTCYLSSSQTGIITLNATAASGWTFAGWDSDSDDCQGTGTCGVPADGGDKHVEYANFSAPSTSTSTLTVNVPLDASGKGGTVYDTTPSDGGANVICGSRASTCAWNALTGSTLTLIEDPDGGYSFAGWSGACSGSAKTCTVNLTTDKTVNATFVAASQTFPLSVTVTGSGNVTGGGITCTSAGGSDCTANEAAGSTVTLTEAADSGASFSGWGGACGGTAKTCIVTMSAAKSVSASFSTGGGGGGGGGGATSALLSVSVSGSGTVTGGGISCGGGSTVCSAKETPGSVATLTASASPGATFSEWGGACSGSRPTCAVAMSADRNVTATFSGATSSKSRLSVGVRGNGTVKGPGIDCGSGRSACRAGVTTGSTVTLTATTPRGSRFLGWQGACTGGKPTCTLILKGAIAVTARFSGTGTTAAVLSARGRPVIGRSGSIFMVTLRFSVSQAGTARISALRAGQVVTSLKFGLAAGPAIVGPFPVALPGYYTFQVALGSGSLSWNACLGRCGAAAPSSAGIFSVRGSPPTVTPVRSLFRVTLHFEANRATDVEVRAFLAGRLVRQIAFAASAGRSSAPPFQVGPGTFRLTLTAHDAFGRVQVLTWFAVLH